MKKSSIILLLLIMITACTTEQKKPEPPYRFTQEDRLNSFFKMCEKDINRAGNVIISNDLIKNLTHLLKMNYGGKKYYILERETITAMINSVTEGIYSDYILINKSGTVVYTGQRDDVFGKNVRLNLKGTSLFRSFTERDKPIYFNNIEQNSSSPYQDVMMISKKLKGMKSLPGIFILQLNISGIQKLLDPGTEIVNSEGLYIISHDKTRLFKPFVFFDQIKKTKLKKGTIKTANKKSKTIIKFNHISFRNINWLLISGEPK